MKSALTAAALVGRNGGLAPFAGDCARRENGMQTISNPPPAQPMPYNSKTGWEDLTGK